MNCRTRRVVHVLSSSKFQRLAAINVCLLVACLLQPHVALGEAQPAVDFDKQIAPLLASRCLDCHNATESKGGLDLS